ncbi:hypothetical protein [Actinoplanes solisilvae]|uniref:hypothetical protein n=1 Tax=Actinoplanes solisilvae TaxID=2486853 RepID=UPI000FD818D0|nr:hypothetical protein [Actinoplanes solisilvae]
MTARRVSIAVVGALVAALVAAVLLRPGRAVPAATSGASAPPRPVATSGAPAPPSTSAATPATPPVAPPVDTARPPASVAATAEAGGSPAPFVQPFAAQPGVKPLPARPSPTAKLSIPPNVDGCDRAYGTRTQCVPTTFPASAKDKCAWLLANGFTGLTVRAPDRHRLDLDGNGIACDS